MKSNSNKGIASIIGAVFLILIILSGYALFSMNNIMENELQDVRREMDKLDEARSREKIQVIIDSRDIIIENKSPNLVAIRYIVTTNIFIDNDYKFNDMIQREKSGLDATGTRYINPGGWEVWDSQTLLQTINGNGDYRIIVITDRGSITRLDPVGGP
jgi:hypothetical protein